MFSSSLFIAVDLFSVSAKGSSKSGSVQCQNCRTEYVSVCDLETSEIEYVMRFSYGIRDISFPQSIRHELWTQEENPCTLCLNFLSPQERSQVAQQLHCYSLDCRENQTV